ETLKCRKGRNAGADGAHCQGGFGIGEKPHAVVEFERNISSEEGGRNRSVDARHAGERLAHRSSCVDRQDDLVIALDLPIATEQQVMASRLLPVDCAAIHAFDKGKERAEFGAASYLAPGRFTGLHLTDKHLALFANRPEVRQDEYGGVLCVTPLFPKKPERPLQAQPR